MDSIALRSHLAARLGFTASAQAELLFSEERRIGDGYEEHDARFRGADGEVPALLMLTTRPSGGGVVVHHQHASQWHLGKSEVVGRGGHQWQAFGPALARHGVSVSTADALGFEDRRPGQPG